MASRTRARILSYGRAAGADVRACTSRGTHSPGRSFTLADGGERARVHLRIYLASMR